MTIPTYRDEWSLLSMKPPNSEEIWMFRKNLGVSEISGHESLSTVVYFTVGFEPRDATGLPNPEDTKVLYDFEESVIPKIEEEARCILVASVVKAGVKDHMFYASDPDSFIRAVNGHCQALGNLKVSLEKHHDPNWEAFADFPEGD